MAKAQAPKSTALGANRADPELVEGPPPSELRTPETPLTLIGKRLCLARAVDVDLLDCLDDTGSFDLPTARRVLSGGIVQELIVDETERIDRAGGKTIRRKIRVKVIDKVRAMKEDGVLAKYASLQENLDEQTERAEKAEARAKQAESRAAQADAAHRQTRDDIDKEVASRAWVALHLIFKDSVGNFLPGVTPQAFGAARDRLAIHHPRPP